MTDAHGVTTYSYDVRDRLVAKATPTGRSATPTTSRATSRRSRPVNTGGVVRELQYDALNRLAKVVDRRLGDAETT